LSKLQDDDKRLQQAAKVFLKNTTAIILPIMITTIIIAKPFIILTLTEKWSTMIPFLQLLCIVGILYIYEDINLKIILAKGKSRYNFWLMLIKNILTILNLTIMYRFGIVYIIIGEIILSFISMIISSLFTQNIINYGFLKQMKDTMPILLLGVAAGVSAFLVTLLTSNLWIHFFVGSLFSIGLYALFQYLFNPTFFSEVYTMGEALIKKNRVI
jgi:O-antigen/teichoic acid export membrane protein